MSLRMWKTHDQFRAGGAYISRVICFFDLQVCCFLICFYWTYYESEWVEEEKATFHYSWSDGNVSNCLPSLRKRVVLLLCEAGRGGEDRETQGEEFLWPWSEEEDEEEDKEQEGWNCVELIFPWVWQLLCLPRCPVIAAMANCCANKTPEEQTSSQHRPQTACCPGISSMDHAIIHLWSRHFVHVEYGAVREATF